jgi:hypothetical protein
MLWLNKNQSIKKISLGNYLNVIKKQGFNVRKILKYSQSSCVCLTASNTIIKALNPSLAEYQFKNLCFANNFFLKQGVIAPPILSVKRDDFYIIENKYIKPELFVDKMSLIKADKIFSKIFNQLSKKINSGFGPFIKKDFLPPAFTNCNYIKYWDTQFEYFLNKDSKNSSFIDDVRKYYRMLRRKVNIPNRFILAHSDISPKHIFVCKSKIGCIDLEEAMYLDDSFMWAIWYVRTIHKRNDELANKFLVHFLSYNLDLNWLNFHIYRELFIQYFYQKLFNRFFTDYSGFLRQLNFLISKT